MRTDLQDLTGLALQFTLQLPDLLTILLRLLSLGVRLCGTVGVGLQTRFAPGLEQALDMALKGAGDGVSARE